MRSHELPSVRPFLATLLLAFSAPAAALTPVSDFDVGRYNGLWYEVAAIPGYFRNKCARDTQSEYSPAEDGALIVRSKCTQSEGGSYESEGRARALDPAVPAVLKVTFVYQLGIWWYPFGRNQIVIGTGRNYEWLVIGDPSLHYGRIIARQPTLSSEALKAAAGVLAAEGFDLCAFVANPQVGGRQQMARLCDEVK
jgi:apolipoprotein D and lipocalin family protein